MQKFPLSLPKLWATAFTVFIAACQSPTRPQNTADPVVQNENEYPQEMARVVPAK
ncbi:hypothetical protein [Chitinophaga rhizosphaerae]|uniref:hypothetical protein n=1 Tax=Chitinophaga rhizosphaerae TaxID=1864947 RepID=UPI0013DF2C03|nr:hypothetical protein [Chitinophaga rhizosphaerae]